MTVNHLTMKGIYKHVKNQGRVNYHNLHPMAQAAADELQKRGVFTIDKKTGNVTLSENEGGKKCQE